MSELIILSIPFLGTSLGAAMVFFVRDKIAPKLEKLLLGFAAGVMIAASVWSLLIPAIDMTEAQGGSDYFPAPLRRGNEPEKSICMWRFVRNRRTNRRLYYDSDRRTDLTGAAISSGICGRSYDVCRDRGADPGMSGWNAQ